MTKTKSASGNEGSTSLDLEREGEEGLNRMLPMRESVRRQRKTLCQGL